MLRAIGLCVLLSGSLLKAATIDNKNLSLEKSPFPDVTSLRYKLDGRGDASIVYYPQVTEDRRFPLIVFLQGGRVPQQYYQKMAATIASHGFAVTLTDRLKAFPTPASPEIYIPDQVIIQESVNTLERLSKGTEQQKGLPVDTGRIGVSGHSIGGTLGLQALSGICKSPFCEGPLQLPPTVRAAAFFGTDLIDVQGNVIAIETQNYPIALIRGSQDSRVTADEMEKSFVELDGTRVSVTIDGLNHFGICDVNSPPGSGTDSVEPTRPQDEGIALSAFWISLFFRAHLENDPLSHWLVYQFKGWDSQVFKVHAELAQ